MPRRGNDSKPVIVPTAGSSPERSRFRWLLPALALLAAAAAFAVFLPALGAEFVNWDDHETLLNNPHFRGLGPTQLKWMFTSFERGHYIPLSWVSYGLDFVFWGMDPAGYHLTNLLLHCANAALFCLLAARLLRLAMPERTAERPVLTEVSAWFAALFFAVHPLRAQSVAWVTERRDVLSGLFFMIALLLYLQAQERPAGTPGRRKRLGGCVGIFVLALLSKETAVWLLPFLVILDIYPLRRFRGESRRWTGPEARRVWLEKTPFVLLVLAEAIVVIAAHAEGGVSTSIYEGSFAPLSRLMLYCFTVVNYLRMTLLPAGILPVHYIPVGLDLFNSTFQLSVFVTILLTCVLVFMRRRWPALLAAWAVHAVSYAPLLFLLGMTAELSGGRMTYLPGLGFALLAGAAFFHGWRLSAEPPRRGLQVLTAALALSAAAGLGTLTWRQARLWHDSVTLWTHLLRVDPDNYLAHFKLGQAYELRNDLNSAYKHYTESLKILPTQYLANKHLGGLFLKAKRFEEAALRYRRCIRLRPHEAEAYNELGNVFFQQKRMDRAEDWYRRALTVRRGYAPALINLGNVFAMTKDYRGAAREYRRALESAPRSSKAHNNLGAMLKRLGKPREAVASYQRAVALAPNWAEARANLCGALVRIGQPDQAVLECLMALKIQPGMRQAQRNLKKAETLFGGER